MAPKYSTQATTGAVIINYNRYKRELKGLRKAFWQVVYKLQSYQEVAAMDIDTFLEAYAALDVINQDTKQGGGDNA